MRSEFSFLGQLGGSPLLRAGFGFGFIPFSAESFFGALLVLAESVLA